MEVDIFKRFDSWAKQRNLAIHIVARLKSLQQVEHPCLDYASALALAQLIVQVDVERLVQSVNVYGTFVRIIRNEKGSFAFSPIVIDHYQRCIHVSGG